MADKVDMKSMQKTCFIVTVNLGHICKETEWTEVSEEEIIAELEAHWEEMTNLPNLAIARGQIERNSNGTLHINAGLKFSKVWRARTLENKWGCWAEPALNERAVMSYGKKTDTRVQALPNVGEIKKKSNGAINPKMKALSMLIDEGMSPVEIAVQAPEVYFTHHRAILETWKMLQVAKRDAIVKRFDDEEE